MKMFPLVLMLAISPLAAEPPSAANLQKEAVAAFNAGNYTAAKSLFESVLSQDPKNLVAKNYLATIAKKTKGAGLEKSLSIVVIPKANFEDVSARDAVEFVSQQVKTITEGKQAVNVVWMVPEEKESRVTLSLQNVPASEVLKYIASAANLELEYDTYAVKVKPAVAATAVTQ